MHALLLLPSLHLQLSTLYSVTPVQPGKPTSPEPFGSGLVVRLRRVEWGFN